MVLHGWMRKEVNRAAGASIPMIVTEALRNLISAWEKLPPGNYRPHEVQRWLKEDMKPAVDEARAALASAEGVNR